jgi:hypothetical protein
MGFGTLYAIRKSKTHLVPFAVTYVRLGMEKTRRGKVPLKFATLSLLKVGRARMTWNGERDEH